MNMYGNGVAIVKKKGIAHAQHEIEMRFTAN